MATRQRSPESTPARARKAKQQADPPQRRKPKMGKPTFRIVPADDGPKAPEFAPQERDYFASLHQMIDLIFEEAANSYQYTWSQLASHADLSYHTVEKLGDRVTKYPRFQTVFKLAKAVGWTLIPHAEKKGRKAGAAKLKVTAG